MVRRCTRVLLLMLLACLPIATHAQSTSAPPPGITVTGVGLATAPADSAIISIQLMANTALPGGAVPLAATPAAADVQTQIVGAVADLGISADAVTVTPAPFQGQWSADPVPPTYNILITLQQPTVKQISDVQAAIIDYAGPTGWLVSTFSVRYDANDCAALWATARQNAYADAQTQIAAQAEILKVTPGAVIASRDVPAGTMAMVYVPPASNCSIGAAGSAASVMYSGQMFDPSVEPTVAVVVAVEITVAIP